ncbi:MAG: VanZ family protein [Robiginitomaculum sp.]|nr:VanZ family protein [Robiginitomaculum sp.]MDQ7076405.1 VanZ family protein [Robiginitomaculum sp.]
MSVQGQFLSGLTMVSSWLNRHQRMVRWVFWLTLILVLALSLKPSPFSIPHLQLSDKVEHFLAYLALGTLMGFGWAIHKVRPVMVALLILTLVGGAVEIIQGTPWIGRTASWLDLLADILGAFMGLMACAALHRRLQA